MASDQEEVEYTETERLQIIIELDLPTTSDEHWMSQESYLYALAAYLNSDQWIGHVTQEDIMLFFKGRKREGLRLSTIDGTPFRML